MNVLIASFVASLIITLGIIRFVNKHGNIFLDSDMTGIQKFHVKPVSRVGGLGVFIAVMVGIVTATVLGKGSAEFYWKIVLSSLPVIIVGIAEDTTKNVGVKVRFVASGLSGILGGMLLDGWVNRVDFFNADILLVVWPVYLVVTFIAIAGIVNSYNIIDGYNGLLGVVGIAVLVGISYVARQVGDIEIFIFSMAAAGALLGFLVWNFPYGMIFLGDGGAYFIGFIIGELSILLVARNNQVSPWCPLLLSYYPIFETLYSIYRKRIKRGLPASLPDGLHLHMLIYKRIVRWAVGSTHAKDKTMRNALTSPYLWVLSCFSIVPAVVFWDNTGALLFFIVCFSLFYIYIYSTIVNYKLPKWLKLKK